MMETEIQKELYDNEYYIRHHYLTPSDKKVSEYYIKKQLLERLLPYAKQQDELLKEAISVLNRNLKDMDNIDKVCELAQVHSFDLMRKDIEQFLLKYKESTNECKNNRYN